MTITGLIPAAGNAVRIDGLPKMLLPVAEGHLLGTLVNRMRSAGADQIWVGANKTNAVFIKPYIDNVLLNGKLDTVTMTETVLAARETCGDSTVLFGMPDSYWMYRETYPSLVNRITEFNADVAVGLWQIRDDQRGKLGQCHFGNDKLIKIIDKDPECPYLWAWGAVAWQPIFWDLLKPEMPHIGMALQAAIDAQLQVMPVLMEGDYYDCGTRDEYFQLCSTFTRVYA